MTATNTQHTFTPGPSFKSAYKIVLSGLSANSWGDGLNRRSVRHAVLTADYERGRLKRKAGDLLCGNNRGSFDLSVQDGDSITCPKCCAAIAKAGS